MHLTLKAYLLNLFQLQEVKKNGESGRLPQPFHESKDESPFGTHERMIDMIFHLDDFHKAYKVSLGHKVVIPENWLMGDALGAFNVITSNRYTTMFEKPGVSYVSITRQDVAKYRAKDKTGKVFVSRQEVELTSNVVNRYYHLQIFLTGSMQFEMGKLKANLFTLLHARLAHNATWTDESTGKYLHFPYVKLTSRGKL